MNAKKDFPIFRRRINGNKLVYLDSAATTQKPKVIINAFKNFYENFNANVHRGIYKISEEATQKYEEAHELVAKFINAEKEEIVFTKNTTESINLVAYSLSRDLKEGDEIVVTRMEHHSNFVPWQQIAKEKKCLFRVIEIDENGKLNEEDLKNEITNKTKIVAITQLSNVLGTMNDIKNICNYSHQFGALVLVDGAQSAPRMKIDMKDIGCDFFVFSAHKMLGPTGLGILYGKKELLEKMNPFLFGGDMIKKVTIEDTKWNDLPWKFEAGTPPIAEAVAFMEAVNYLQKIEMEKILEHEKKLTKYGLKRLKGFPDLKIYGSGEKLGVISFNIENLHPHDVATILDRYGIAIRAGHHCTQPLMEKLGISACCRVSFYIYNSKKDIDLLVEGLKKAVEVLNK